MAVYKLNEDYNDDRQAKMEKAKAFAESLDLNPLFDKIDSYVGAKLSYNLETVPDEYNSSYKVKFTTDDIRKYCGVFGKILSKCIIDGDTGIGIDDSTGEMFYWAQPHLTYQHKDGGRNGMSLFRAWYSESDGWNFRE